MKRAQLALREGRAQASSWSRQTACEETTVIQKAIGALLNSSTLAPSRVKDVEKQIADERGKHGSHGRGPFYTLMEPRVHGRKTAAAAAST
jgi:hypothetical protein